MLPPIGERRVETREDEADAPEAAARAKTPPDPVPAERRRQPRARDLVALYAARADANGFDLRPVIDERRERRPTEPVSMEVGPAAIKPRAVGRGTAAHRDAVRRARGGRAGPVPFRGSGDPVASPKEWCRWLPTGSVAKLANVVGAVVRGVSGPRMRGRPRSRRAVQGRA